MKQALHLLISTVTTTAITDVVEEEEPPLDDSRATNNSAKLPLPSSMATASSSRLGRKRGLADEEQSSESASDNTRKQSSPLCPSLPSTTEGNEERGGGEDEDQEEDEEEETEMEVDVEPDTDEESAPSSDSNLQLSGSRSGTARTYVHQHGSRRVQWRQGACPYDGAAADVRRRELLTSTHSTEANKCELFAKRVVEIMADNPSGPPLTRINELLDQVTSTLQPVTDCLHADFAERAFQYVRALLLESHRVDFYAQRRIGQFFNSTVNLSSTPTSAVLEVANQASTVKMAYFRRIRNECARRGCVACRDTSSSSGTASQTTEPCATTQALCRLKDHEFENFTSTFLNACIPLAQLPAESPLLLSADPRGQLRDLLRCRGALQQAILDKGLPSMVTGGKRVFALRQGENPVVAVQYVDGDGGHIISNKFPGLHDYLTRQGLCPQPVVTLDFHGYTLLPFREQHHDAIELGHEYQVKSNKSSTLPTHSTGYIPLGYDALVAARGNLSRAQNLWIVPSGLQGLVNAYIFVCSYIIL